MLSSIEQVLSVQCRPEAIASYPLQKCRIEMENSACFHLLFFSVSIELYATTVDGGREGEGCIPWNN